MNDVLKIDKILDFCDVPQLFVARDVFDTLYLCLLYADEPACRYTGIRISAQRLESFMNSGIDLRALFIAPEEEYEYYDVEFGDGGYQKRLLSKAALPEEKLPVGGYSLSGDVRENVVVNLPVKDRSLLTELVRKFGWACM